MKCVCEKEKLLEAISLVSRLATTRATLPILQNIYLEATREGLLVRATDLEQTLEAQVAANVSEPGKLTVPARMLADYLGNNGDHSLTLETDDLTLHVNSTNHTATFKGLAAEEYPTLPTIKVDTSLSLNAAELSEALGQVSFAAAVDDSRPVLAGVLWRFTEGSLELVSTDGYRLAYVTLPNPGAVTGDYIIPRRAVQELVRTMGSDTVTVAFAGTQASFTTPQAKLTSRILEGKFPDYAAILPKKKEVAVELSAAAFARSLKLASLFSRDSAYSTKLILEEKKLAIEATSIQLGENRNEIALEQPVAAPLTIAANAQYLIEALGHIPGTVSLELIDHKSPIVLRPVGAAHQTIYLVMPLRNE